MRTDGGAPGGGPRGLSARVQGEGPRPRVRRVLEGMGGHGGQGHQRVPPELPRPPAPRDAPESLRGFFGRLAGVMTRMRPPAPFGLPPLPVASGGNPTARCWRQEGKAARRAWRRREAAATREGGCRGGRDARRGCRVSAP